MGTRCSITLKAGRKKYTIYNQFDGYLEGRGMDCLEMAKNAQALKEALAGVEIIERKNFDDEQYVNKLEKRIDSGELKYPESDVENFGRSYRFYDDAGENILGILDGKTNFLVTEELSYIKPYIEYQYEINLNTGVVQEKINGLTFTPEQIQNMTEEKMKLLNETLV